MDVDARLSALEAENESLRDEIDRLREAFGSGPTMLPVEWRLTGKEASIFGALMAREGVTKDQLMSALYDTGIDDEPHIKIVDVFVCKIRKKLKPFGIEIDTLWGRGYAMAPESKAVARGMMAPRAEAA